MFHSLIKLKSVRYHIAVPFLFSITFAGTGNPFYFIASILALVYAVGTHPFFRNRKHFGMLVMDAAVFFPINLHLLGKISTLGGIQVLWCGLRILKPLWLILLASALFSTEAICSLILSNLLWPESEETTRNKDVIS